jgi:arachidonate 15-lipoxygenase (second type)/8-lipoxygenase (S-type)
MSASATLPFHPQSLYQPVPKQKRSVQNLATFLPPYNKAQEQININALFSRNYLAGTNRTRKLTLLSLLGPPYCIKLKNF